MTSQDQSRQRLCVSELSRGVWFLQFLFPEQWRAPDIKPEVELIREKKKKKELVASGVYPSLRS